MILMQEFQYHKQIYLKVCFIYLIFIFDNIIVINFFLIIEVNPETFTAEMAYKVEVYPFGGCHTTAMMQKGRRAFPNNPSFFLQV